MEPRLRRGKTERGEILASSVGTTMIEVVMPNLEREINRLRGSTSKNGRRKSRRMRLPGACLARSASRSRRDAEMTGNPDKADGVVEIRYTHKNDSPVLRRFVSFD